MGLVAAWFRIPFWQRVLGAFVLGGLAGWLMGPAAEVWLEPLGDLYVTLIKMIAVPLVFFAVINAVASLAGQQSVAALGGRTFVLTTTLRVLPLVAQALRAAAPGLTVLMQGSEPRRALLQRFGDGRGCVLVGSASFWEGIDMPGDALQCVLIDKLPFPPPNDPLVEARVRQLREEGRNPFNDYFVAEAAVSLKQGAGRLIRTESDRGLLVVCDMRVRQMGYGKRLLAALPPMGQISDEPEALAWLAALAADH